MVATREARDSRSVVIWSALDELRGRWLERVRPICESLGLPAPDPSLVPDPDGRLRRTDEFSWLHGELTMVARSEEAATW